MKLGFSCVGIRGDAFIPLNFSLFRNVWKHPQTKFGGATIYFGRFRGFLLDDTGERHEINDYYGVTENMDARF